MMPWHAGVRGSFSRRVKGTLGIILLAQQRGLISSAAEVIRSLRATGFHLDDQIIREALSRTTGEQWIP